MTRCETITSRDPEEARTRAAQLISAIIFNGDTFIGARLTKDDQTYTAEIKWEKGEPDA